VDGLVFSGAYQTTNPVTVTIGGMDATVLWAGLVGPGLYQVNVTIPPALPDGDHAVVASVAGSNSPSGALVKVAASAKLNARSATRRGFLARNDVSRPLHGKASIERVAWLGALVTPEQRTAANVSASSREGCLVRIA